MTRKLQFDSDTCQLAGVRKVAREFFTGCGIDECETELMVLAIDEACTNIIRHAYKSQCRPVRLSMEERGDGSLKVVLRDYGTPCKPSEIRSRELTDFRPGGVGVHIIHRAFDQVTYLPQRRGTKLVLVKNQPTNRTEREKN